MHHQFLQKLNQLVQAHQNANMHFYYAFAGFSTDSGTTKRTVSRPIHRDAVNNIIVPKYLQIFFCRESQAFT
jgi:hypothetical protein